MNNNWSILNEIEIESIDDIAQLSEQLLEELSTDGIRTSVTIWRYKKND